MDGGGAGAGYWLRCLCLGGALVRKGGAMQEEGTALEKSWGVVSPGAEGGATRGGRTISVGARLHSPGQ